MTVQIRYYALLQDQAGQTQETRQTNAVTVADLWDELAAAYAFTLDAELVRAAINDEFCSWDEPLTNNCLVVFMPPVAGG